MKSVIVELRDGYASVLSDDGCIRKIRNKNYELGQVINIDIVGNSLRKKISIFAASAAAILVLGVGSWAYASPYSYVSLDVNPSIEFVLNRFDRVLEVKAGNEDGEGILQEIDTGNLKNKTISRAINQTLNQISEQGYLPNNTISGIVIAASNKNHKKADQLVDEIKNEVEDEIIESHNSVSVEVFSVDMEQVEVAKELGVTPGKLNLVEKLIESSDDSENIQLEEWLDKPVKDIMKATKDNKSDEEASSSSTLDDDDSQDNVVTDNDDKKTVKEAVKDARKAAKEAEKAAKKAEQEAKKTAREIEKETSEVAATEDAARRAREAADNAKNAAKEAEKAERRAKEAKKEKDDKSKKEAEKEAKEAAKEAEKAAKEALDALEHNNNGNNKDKSKDKNSNKDKSKDKNRGNNNKGNNKGNKSGNNKNPRK
ncbi:MAG: hypothetical protein GX129_05125 [Clostridiales bacterium]|jgi:uncharacterized protein (UPF0297 family)|nr:hypothetical protein [Clostridiales bacterium]